MRRRRVWTSFRTNSTSRCGFPPSLRKMVPADYKLHFTEEDFIAAVERIKEYILAGDVMQVVLAQRMSTAFSGDPLNVYRALRF